MPEGYEEDNYAFYGPADQTPVDNGVEEANAGIIQDPDNVTAVCCDCGSTQPTQYLEKSVFAQSGLTVPCKYCGGPCVICYAERVEQTRAVIRRERKIDNTT